MSSINLINNIQDKLSYNRDHSDEFRRALLHIEVEKWLNALYPVEKFKEEPLSISLLSKGSGGFGDVVWGSRAIDSLAEVFLNAKISVISDALDKFKQIDILQGFQKEIEWINSKDEQKVEENLNSCDLALDGPVLHPILYSNFLNRIVRERKLIQGIEYDRGDYNFSWLKETRPSLFISGLGDNTYGIFYIDELLGNDKLSESERIDQIQNQALRDIIRHNISSIKYFGYGYKLQSLFIEIVARFEDDKEKVQDVLIILLNAEGSCFETKSLKKLFLADPLKNIGSIFLLTPKFRLSDEKLQEASERFGIPFNVLKAKQPKMPEGKDYSIEQVELVKGSATGKNLYIVNFYSGLAKQDIMVLHRISEDISMLTGDQSLSEGITMKKKILYDPRKVQTIEWMVLIAKRQGLHLIASFFEAFTFNREASKVVQLLKNPELEREKNVLFSSFEKLNLKQGLQQMAARRIFHLKTDFKLEEYEDKIHDVCENILSSTAATDKNLEKELNFLISQLTPSI